MTTTFSCSCKVTTEGQTQILIWLIVVENYFKQCKVHFIKSMASQRVASLVRIGLQRLKIVPYLMTTVQKSCYCLPTGMANACSNHHSQMLCHCYTQTSQPQCVRPVIANHVLRMPSTNCRCGHNSYPSCVRWQLPNTLENIDMIYF